MIEQMLPKGFTELANIQSKNERSLLERPNVVGVALGNKITNDVDTGQLAVLALVETKLHDALLAKDEMVPKTVDGKQTDVIEVGVIQAGGPAAPTLVAPDLILREFRPARDFTDGREGLGTVVEPKRDRTAEFTRDVLEQEIRDLVLTQRMRPAMGGCSVGHFRITAGTIATGCYDWSAMPGIPNRFYVLSNNHVLANSNDAAIGDPILQPGPYDGGSYPGDLFARLSRFVPIRYMTPGSTPLNYVDAAVAEVPFHYLNREIYWMGTVRRLSAPVTVNDIVQKTGRTTNFSTGRVTAVNATVDVNYGGGRVARFAGQILTTAMSAGGDSGSLVTTLEEEAVGLLFAGSPSVTICSPIRWVQSLLGVRITER